MSLARIAHAVAPAAVAVTAALCLAACGIAAKPEAGTPAAMAAAHAGVDDPAPKHIACLRADHVIARPFTLDGNHWFQVGMRPTGPTVEFLATPGAAQYAQIDGSAQGAEIIGSALLYPHQTPSGLLTEVENCLDQGVQG